jgi:hypothetical protein
MESMALWLTPLILLPGVALLIVSTSARYSEIHAEMHRLLHEGHPEHCEASWVAGHLLERSRRFRNALVSLYAAVTLLAAAGLLGVATAGWQPLSAALVLGLTALGIGGVAAAAVELVRESLRSLQILEEHGRVLAGR